MIKKLGGRIRELRKKKGYSQEKLAEKANISAKYMGEVERGEVNISFSVLSEIASALGVSFDELTETEHIAEKAELINEIQKFLKKSDADTVGKVYLFIKHFC